MVTERHLRFPTLALLFVINLVFAGTPLIKSTDGGRRGSLNLRRQPDRRGSSPKWPSVAGRWRSWFFGKAPGFAALTQINVRVPDAVTPDRPCPFA